MALSVPELTHISIVTDDPYLAARASSVHAMPKKYFPVIDGPRILRPDANAEILRRNNALARAGSAKVLLGGLSGEQDAAMSAQLPKDYIIRCSHDEIENLSDRHRIKKQPLIWGYRNIGVGLLRALSERRLIRFEEDGPVGCYTEGQGEHLVVCEAGEQIAEVIAANYAYALGAVFVIIPSVDEKIADEILEGFYSSESTEIRTGLQQKIRILCGDLRVPVNGSISFFTNQLPFGVGFPNQPSTHIFTYPDCGIAVINGLAAEQSGKRGVNVAVLVDPEKTPAPEIASASRVFSQHGAFVRGYRGQAASVRNITDAVEYFPYDIIFFATHCGDAAGWRWTYKYTDSEAIQRELVVDVAIGVGRTDDPDILDVMQFSYFRSLDGVDWTDPVAKASLYVGRAILDYVERSKDKEFQPLKKEIIDRVRWSAAMAMFDHNYFAKPASLADQGSPIIFNNACVSWHELAARFTSSNARAYIGTLYPVLPFEAEGVTVELLERNWNKFLPLALWRSQKATYGDDTRRPYVMTGVYVQKLRTSRENEPEYLMRRLLLGTREWRRKETQANEQEKSRFKHVADFYNREARAFYKKWFRET